MMIYNSMYPMTEDLISVIIPVYNVSKYLPRCLESVLKQTYRNMEILLIDDGSTDSSGEICEAYVKHDSRIHVIHKQNGGLSSARNAGLDSMHGDYYTFIDSDDFVHPDYVSALLALCMKYGTNISQCGCIHGSDSQFPDRNSDATDTVWNFHDLYTDTDGSYRCTAWGKLYSAKYADERFPVGKINEDEGYSFFLQHRAQRIALTNRQLYYYYMRQGSIMRPVSINPKFDFMEIYGQIIDYLKIKNDSTLIPFVHKELCIRIILRWCAWEKAHCEKSCTERLKTAYRMHYNHITDWSDISVRERFVLHLYRWSPTLFYGLYRMCR